MTPQQNVLEFAAALKANNNREWFNENKDWYNKVRVEFEQITADLIHEISKFDEEVKHLTPKDCLFRIYRDVRFSHDKSPYKSHFGAYIAAPNGRKSQRAGYYLHLEPGMAFASLGIWCPQPNVLKALRQSVYDNIEELDEILNESGFKKYYGQLSNEDSLKTVPKGFPKDFSHAELLKLKHYTTEHKIEEKILKSENLASAISPIYQAGYALNRFLNYTVDEVAY